MLYIKKEINESIDEYVMDEDNVLNLIERVLGDEFRIEVENKIGYKTKTTELKSMIGEMEDDYEKLQDMLSEEVEENISLQRYIGELEEELRNVKN